MNNKWKLILVVGLLLLVTSSVFLSSCSVLTGESASQLDSRITKLENELQANGEAIAKLQQQVQEQQQKVDVLTPASPTSTASTKPTASQVPTAPTTTPASVLAPSSVKMGNLTITPTEVNTGENVTMSIEVSNTGNIEGSYRVVLTEKMVAPQVAPDILEYANLVSLKPGETKTVTFTATKNVAGTYSVQVGSKVGEYTVIDITPPPTSSD